MVHLFQGRDGIPGNQGPPGVDGIPGQNGDVGPSGADGPPVRSLSISMLQPPLMKHVL